VPRTVNISKARKARLEQLAANEGPQQQEAIEELQRRAEILRIAESGEHGTDPVEAAKAVDSKPEKKRPARANSKTVARAVELWESGVKLVKLTNQLTEEGHLSPTGKQLRPQVVRQWLIKAMGVEGLKAEGAIARVTEPEADEPESPDEPQIDGSDEHDSAEKSA
jgi:hypothetical protein